MIAFFFFSRGLTAPHPHLIKAHIIQPLEGWEEGKRGGGKKTLLVARKRTADGRGGSGGIFAPRPEVIQLGSMVPRL